MTHRPCSQTSSAGAPGGPEPSATAQAFLSHVITQGILDALGGQALVLDPEGQLLASSHDALAALGLPNPFPDGTRFPAMADLDLGAKGFLACAAPLHLPAQEAELWVFKDIREQARRDALNTTFFQELQLTLAQLQVVTAQLRSQAGLPEALLEPLEDLATRLRTELLTQRQLLLPRGPDPGVDGAGLGRPALPARGPLLGPGAPVRVPESGRDERSVVLVVDDSTMVLRLLEFLLSKEGYRVVTADNGQEGLALAYEYQPDLILLDAVMPELDGFHVCRALKADPRTRETPILFVTALRGEADEVFALEAGAIDFIPKPVNPAIVVARVRNHLELKHSKDRLRVLSLMDGLTGIGNRRAFDQCLEVEWQRASRNGRPLSLVMGDVDFFKRFNDRFGHGEGDECLRRVAQVFRQALQRPGDMAARYGGEEFVCVLPDTDAAGALLVAEKIQAGVLGLNLAHPDSPVADRLTVSLGVATLNPGPSGQPAALLQEADRNMYKAKDRGRNAIVQEARKSRRPGSRKGGAQR